MGIELGAAHIGKNMRVYAIGDVHGCLDEMNDLLRLIKQDLKQNPIKKHRIIFVGDYVDRGPDSHGVIKKLIKLCTDNPKVTCLIGNHDEKLLLAQKPMDREKFERYLKFGGGETLATYGVAEDQIQQSRESRYSPKLASDFAKMVKKSVSKRHLTFLENLPASTTEGDYFFCHAGIRPDVKLKKQSQHDLMWIREPFLSHTKPHAKVIIHGHTKQTSVDIRNNRINIDTSCVFGGELTAVVLEGTSHSFLTVTARQTYWK